MRERTQIAGEANPKVEKSGWVLTFHDEFNGPELDTTKWYTFYRDVKAIYFIKEGILHLRIDRVLPELGANRTNRVSSIQTVAGWKEWPGGRPFSQRYGRFEIRARCCRGSGRCSAFWMMPADPRYSKLKEDGGIRESLNEAVEIDICEQLGREPMSNHFTVHFGRSNVLEDEGHKQESNAREFAFDHSEDFHIYALEWTQKSLIWYVDGKEVARSNKTAHQPFFILLGVYEQMPGVKGWKGMLESNPSYPCDFEIDYIRVYQRAEVDNPTITHATPSASPF